MFASVLEGASIDDLAEDRASDRGIVECRAGELRTGVDSFYFSTLESRGFFPRGARITALHLLEWSLPRGLEVDKWLRSASSFKKWGWGVAKIQGKFGELFGRCFRAFVFWCLRRCFNSSKDGTKIRRCFRALVKHDGA